MEPIGFAVKYPSRVSLEGVPSVLTVKEKGAGGEPVKKVTPQPENEASTGAFAGNQETLKALANRIMAFLDASNYSIEFVPHQESGRVTIRVLDSAGKVIRQIPPEEINRLSRNAGSGTGILVDEKLG
jgi:uncharacterized FlaG/YvyC family protein